MKTQDVSPIDMTELTNAQLREILDSPETYIAEAVHQAAKELSHRHAVPRYYTYLKPGFSEERMRVSLRMRPGPAEAIKTLFSEANLIRYTQMIALFQGLLLAFQTVAIVRFLKHFSTRTGPPDWFYVTVTFLPFVSTLLFTLFFLSLHRTLKTRISKG
jgi:hypothetical protein